ncbi:hypothetical protein NMY22_g17947 [Coprinellus aureogranulatus]|nr:hypothetical protein NMY22_g17947 [Coprinellus aureogranulatus]
MLSAHEKQVSDLEAEITQINQLMLRLTERRSALHQRINSLAPISRLPPEILIETFHFACCCPSTTPLFLGSVCSAWRTLSWTTPLLWDHITLTVPKLPHSDTQSNADTHIQEKLDLLPEWIARASPLPLHITLSASESSDVTFRILHHLLEALVEYSHFWGSVSLTPLPPSSHTLLFFRHFPLLTKVVMRPPPGSISTFTEPPNVFGAGNAPLLRDVDMVGYDFGSVVLPWAQLRRVKMGFLSVGECWTLLDRCPELEECVLEDVYRPDPPQGHHTSSSGVDGQLVHDKLEVLNVTFLKATAAQLLFDALSLPSLRQLGVHYSQSGTGAASLSPVVSLASRSPLLRKLSITLGSFEEDELIKCFRALPGLDELDLTIRLADPPGPFTLLVRSMPESFLRRFLPPPTPLAEDSPKSTVRVLLPQLKKLRYTGGLSCSVETVLGVLAWRRARKPGDGTGVVRLEEAKLEVTINPLFIPPFDGRRAVDELRKAGLDVEIVVNVLPSEMIE